MSTEETEIEVPEVEDEDIFESLPNKTITKTKQKKEKEPLPEPEPEITETPQEETQEEPKPKKRYGKPYVKKGNKAQTCKDNLAKAREAKARKALERKMKEEQLAQTQEYEIPEPEEEEDEEENTQWVLQQLKPKKQKAPPLQKVSEIKQEVSPWQEQMNQMLDEQKQMRQMFMTMLKTKAKPKTERKTVVQVMPPPAQVIMPEKKETKDSAASLGFKFSI